MKGVFAMNKYSTAQEKIVVRNVNGHVVGRITKGTLRKNVKASKHMLHSPLGWAWDVSIIELAQLFGVVNVVIYDQEQDITYQAPLESYIKFGVKFNRGYGEQICLPLRFWQINQYPNRNYEKTGDKR